MKWVYRLLVLCTVASLAVACHPPDPLPRDAALGDYSGSARWAYELAEPHFAELLPEDGVFYHIVGNRVGLDGRLAANVGSWEFRFWSASQELSRGVTVTHDGEVRRSVLSSGVDPTDRRSPIPNGWLNSTDIYEVICPACGSIQHGFANLNYADPAYGGGEAVWLLLNADTQMVRWDGLPIE
jgi:hypothetical protein